jgi:hypothetical protein
MSRDSFFSEPDVILTMKCLLCKETLIVNENILAGLGQCSYCNNAIDREYARQSTAHSMIINRAITLANTIQTGWMAMLFSIPSAIYLYFLDWKILFILSALLPALVGCLAVIRWGYKYADRHIEDEEFIRTQRVMKVHLKGWMAYVTLLFFALFTW